MQLVVSQSDLTLIIHNFKPYSDLNKQLKMYPYSVVMSSALSYQDHNRFLSQAVNMLMSSVNLGILIWQAISIVLLLEPASSGHWMNCSFLTLLY